MNKFGINVKPAAGMEQLINHVCLVIDASSSMNMHREKVREVIKSEIASLAKESTSFNQETRISIYTFSNAYDIQCLVYDKDVLRLPDVAKLYNTRGSTALVDACLVSAADLLESSVKYGDHSFLQIVITDGEENDSRNSSNRFNELIGPLTSTWTFLAFVPNLNGAKYMAGMGFDPNNCIQWNTMSATGFQDVGVQVRQATNNYFTNRSQGIRSSNNLLAMDTSNVTKSVVDKNLFALTMGSYYMLNVAPAKAITRPDGKVRIDDFMRQELGAFSVGKGFYQLTKPEIIQASKQICLVDKVQGTVYGGDKARSIIGLPPSDVKVAPDYNKQFDIFVQSTAPNRNLISGTRLLVMR